MSSPVLSNSSADTFTLINIFLNNTEMLWTQIFNLSLHPIVGKSLITYLSIVDTVPGSIDVFKFNQRLSLLWHHDDITAEHKTIWLYIVLPYLSTTNTPVKCCDLEIFYILPLHQHVRYCAHKHGFTNFIPYSNKIQYVLYFHKVNTLNTVKYFLNNPYTCMYVYIYIYIYILSTS